MTGGPPRRSFFEYHPGAGDAELRSLLLATPEEAGPELRRFRGSFPVSMAGGVAGLMIIVFTLIGFLVRAIGATWTEAAGVVAVGVLVGLLAASGLLLTGAAYVTRVHVHGLVLSSSGGARRFVPYTTIDPGRVVLTRGELLGRHLTTVMHRSRYVAGPVVVLNGLDPQSLGAGALEDVLVPVRPERPHPGPFGWWVVSSPDPAALLTAVEEAMVATGLPAEGLAHEVLATPQGPLGPAGLEGVYPQRRLTDPVVGLAGRRAWLAGRHQRPAP